MQFEPQDKQRYERLGALSPLAAVQAWLDGAFGIGDEPALLKAIRRDSRVMATDRQITELICDAMQNELNAAVCLERLAGAADNLPKQENAAW